MANRIIISITLLLSLLSTSFAQQKLVLDFVKKDSSDYSLPKSQDFDSKISLVNYLDNLVDDYVQQGYLLAGVDSLQKDSLSYTAYFYRGEKIQFSALRKGNLEEDVMKAIAFEQFIRKKKKEFSDFLLLRNRVLSYYENKGYPFATVRFDSVEVQNNEITACLMVEKNSLFIIDSLVNRGNAKISSYYLQEYLRIREQDVYNESEIRKISRRCKEIPFVQTKKDFEISFSDGKAKILLYLDEKKASSFDGILGIQPSNDVPVKIVLSGDLRLQLLNSLGKGESIKLHWRKLDVQTQDVKAKFNYPYLFTLPFGLDYDFKLYKQDTSYISVYNDIGVQYFFSSMHYLKFFVKNNQSFMLNTGGLEYLSSLPDYADVRVNMPGLAYSNNVYDYLYNPRKGYRWLFDIGIGVKNIKENSDVNPQLYENIKMKSYQLAAELDADVFLPLLKRSSFMFRLQSAFMHSDQLFQNELFRIGGLKTLRGFDEESIFASMFAVFTTEYRFVLEKRSYLSAFFDYAYYENYSMNKAIIDRPFGFGVGFSVDTKAGIFTINYALGKQFDNPILFKSAKIHFGITAVF